MFTPRSLLLFPYGNMTDYWGVVQSVGHLTVNEDGVGSSPTAPANPSHRLGQGCGRFRLSSPE
jgi:hypothetical protein